jgi:hypothetical protein
MNDSTEKRISGLLQQGLESYGTGDIAQAFLHWNEVLELDPGNEEALDYMRDADRRSKPRDRSLVQTREGSLVDEARRILRVQDEEAALELLSSAPTGASQDLECVAMSELLRARLFQRYREELGDLSQVPRLVEDGAMDLRSRNLPPTAGFLLSMIDGMTPLSDLVSVSGMDRFEALRSLHRMLEAGIVEWGS